MMPELKISEPAWATGPARPRLSEGAVHVWRADLAAGGEGHLDGLANTEERARAARLLSAESGRLWLRSRAVLRALLARYLGGDPRELRFASGAHGKPALARPPSSSRGHAPGDEDLFFNLSHSGTVALYAVSAGCEVGVDVERERERDAVVEQRLAARLLGEERARAHAELAPEVRRRELLGAWTRYEAELKCRGTGIGEGLPHGAAAQPACWVAALDLGPGFAAAVAAGESVAELSCWSWRDAGA
jgi:4'-phosphopantetheinyl transferase